MSGNSKNAKKSVEASQRENNAGSALIQEADEDNVKVVPVAPDGGYGWIIVACSFFCNFIVDGVAYSFAIYLVEWQEKFPESDKGTIALIGSLLNGVYLLMGPISSALTNAFGFKKVIFSGALIAATAFIISMFATGIPFLIGVFGILGGIGFGLIYSPAILCVCYYFDKKRAMAVGISVCGSGVGAFVFPPIIQIVIDHFGWRGSMLILAGLVLQVCVAGSLMRNLEVEVVEEVEMRPVADDTAATTDPLLGDKGRETATYVRDSGADAGGHRGMKHIEHGRAASLASNDLENRISTRYSSKDKIDVQTMDDQGRIVHNIQTGPYHHHSSQQDINETGGHGPHRHHEVAHPLDRKDVLVHGSLKHLNRQESEREDVEAFRRASVRRREEKKAKEAAAKSGTPAKTGWMPPQLRQALIEMIDVSIYTNVIFLIFSLASFLGMIAFYVPFTFVTDVAVETWGTEKVMAAYLISGIGGANIFGRIFWGWLADRPRSDPLLIHNICIIVVGITLGCVPLCTKYGDYNALMGACVIFGFFVSPFISLLSIILTSRIGLDQLPSAFGQSQLVRGIASMCGTPIGAALFNVAKDYDLTFLVSGAEFIIASVIASMIFVVAYFNRKRAAKSGNPLRSSVVA